MCENCELPAPFVVAGACRRVKLWEIAGRHHCTIIGTCLSMRELWKLARKAKLRFPDDLSDYELHGVIVSSAALKDPLGRLIHRMLDRKFRSAVDQCKKLPDTGALGAYWAAALASGDIPGPLWAVMSHGAADQPLREQVFGDVHMLSHLVGASNRADIKRLESLEAELEIRSDTLEYEKARARQAVEERDQQIEVLKIELAAQTGVVRRAAMIESRLERFENGETITALSRRNRELTDQVSRLDEAAAAADQAIRDQKKQIGEQSGQIGRLSTDISALCAERDSLEAVLEQGLERMCRQCEQSAGQPGAGAIDLSGTRIVYIGGRTSHISHIRLLVEQANGEFHHHDGGLEDGEGRLECVLGRGDVVMCPVDCVSHNACLKAKKFCKHAGKSFVPLRSSGLSSFASGLQTFALKAPPAGEQGAGTL